jgi:hypothetical protein
MTTIHLTDITIFLPSALKDKRHVVRRIVKQPRPASGKRLVEHIDDFNVHPDDLEALDKMLEKSRESARK